MVGLLLWWPERYAIMIMTPDKGSAAAICVVSVVYFQKIKAEIWILKAIAIICKACFYKACLVHDSFLQNIDA